MIALTCAAAAIADAAAPGNHFCRHGDRGRLLDYQRVASYPTPHDARAHFDEWIAFYQDFFQFPADLPVTFEYGFDSYKVTYCTMTRCCRDSPFAGRRPPRAWYPCRDDPGRSRRWPTCTARRCPSTTPRRIRTSFGDFSPRGESFEGPPSTAVFAGNGFIYVAPDYLGLGDSTVPRHRYFHADTEASSAIDLLAAAQPVLADLRVGRTGDSSSSAAHRVGMRRWPCSASWNGCG